MTNPYIELFLVLLLELLDGGGDEFRVTADGFLQGFGSCFPYYHFRMNDIINEGKTKIFIRLLQLKLLP